ncbi:MAG: transglycosylase SLT domain-containing protein, partial [Phycisphaerae bacterium]|nr:transglycosylase SLT domain-containing protein [Phycisphaerae bacterium]
MAEVLNEFVISHRHRTEFGNIIFRRYVQNVPWVLNPNLTADRERYEQTKPIFELYSRQYDLDPLLLTALGYQESRLDQSVRSPVGAVGVMQLTPST